MYGFGGWVTTLGRPLELNVLRGWTGVLDRPLFTDWVSSLLWGRRDVKESVSDRFSWLLTSCMARPFVWLTTLCWSVAWSLVSYPYLPMMWDEAKVSRTWLDWLVLVTKVSLIKFFYSPMLSFLSSESLCPYRTSSYLLEFKDVSERC